MIQIEICIDNIDYYTSIKCNNVIYINNKSNNKSDK